jgi:hypothetical protein
MSLLECSDVIVMRPQRKAEDYPIILTGETECNLFLTDILAKVKGKVLAQILSW